jgi:hypothetical protein
MDKPIDKPIDPYVFDVCRELPKFKPELKFDVEAISKEISDPNTAKILIPYDFFLSYIVEKYKDCEGPIYVNVETGNTSLTFFEGCTPISYTDCKTVYYTTKYFRDLIYDIQEYNRNLKQLMIRCSRIMRYDEYIVFDRWIYSDTFDNITARIKLKTNIENIENRNKHIHKNNTVTKLDYIPYATYDPDYKFLPLNLEFCTKSNSPSMKLPNGVTVNIDYISNILDGLKKPSTSRYVFNDDIYVAKYFNCTVRCKKHYQCSHISMPVVDLDMYISQFQNLMNIFRNHQKGIQLAEDKKT